MKVTFHVRFGEGGGETRRLQGPKVRSAPTLRGGSIPLEAQRLGLEAHASDLNPVAVMINKAQIEIPSRFAGRPPVNPADRKKVGSSESWKGAAGLAADVRYYGNWMRERAYERIGHLYPEMNGETVLAWIWARTVKSPNPAVDAHVPLINNYWLTKKGENVWLEPVVDRPNRSYRFEIQRGKPRDTSRVSKGTKLGRASFKCLLSDTPIDGKYIDEEASQGRMGVFPLAIVTEAKPGRAFYTFDEHNTNCAEEAESYLEVETPPELVPNELAKGTFASNAQGRIYGFDTFADYFTARQLVALVTFGHLLNDVQTEVLQDACRTGWANDGKPLSEKGREAKAYAEALTVYLAFALDRSADYWSTLATPADGFIRSTFARQGIAMSWDFAEVNPFSNSSGNWMGAVDWISRVLDKLVQGPLGEAVQADAAKSVYPSQVVISTDPPYYGNVNYADLADYFYVWLRRSLRDVFPSEFQTLLTPKATEIVAIPSRFDGSSNAADNHFEMGLLQAFSSMRYAIEVKYPLTVFYAFKQEEIVSDSEVASTGWETMLNSLIDSGFSIVGTWPMRTERSARIVSLGTNALASSIVLVCRPRSDDAPMTSRRQFVAELRQALPAALREMQSGNIAPVDLAQASIGPGMAVYSKYGKVLEPNGERLTVRTALQLINQVLDEYLAEAEGDVDADTRFAVDWFKQYGFEEGAFGMADVLARAKNTSVEGLANAGVLKSGAGKVRLLSWDELDAGWDPSTDKRVTTWEATHHLIERLNTHGEEGAAMLLAKMAPDLAAAARQLAYRLYSICERKSWAALARDYNALVVSWSATQEQAAKVREQPRQGELFE